NVGDPEVERAAGELRHSVAGAVAARDRDIDAFFGKDAFLPAAVIHRVLARRQPIGLEPYLVGGGGWCGREESSGEDGDERQCTCWMLHEGTPAPGTRFRGTHYSRRGPRLDSRGDLNTSDDGTRGRAGGDRFYRDRAPR